MNETLADVMRQAGIRPAWEGLANQRPARPGLNRGGHGAPPYQRPAMRAMATRGIEQSLGGGESSRNQLENTAQGALEMTGLPSVRRSARAFASGDPATGFLQGGLGALGVIGMAAGGPRGAGAVADATIARRTPTMGRTPFVNSAAGQGAQRMPTTIREALANHEIPSPNRSAFLSESWARSMHEHLARGNLDAFSAVLRVVKQESPGAVVSTARAFAKQSDVPEIAARADDFNSVNDLSGAEDFFTHVWQRHDPQFQTNLRVRLQNERRGAGAARHVAPPPQADLFPETAPGALRAFHGTFKRFNDFEPWQHFGTERAARERLRAVRNEGYGSAAAAPGERGRIIPVEIMGQRINVGDEIAALGGGSTRLSDVAEMLRRSRHITQEEYAYATEPLINGNRYLGRNSQEVVGERLQDIMRRKNIGAIGYRNQYEDTGSMSYIVPDPAMVRPVAMEAPPARLPVNPARPIGRAADGSVMPVAPSAPFRNSLRGGSDDLMDATRRAKPASLDESSQRALRDWYLSDPLRDHSRLPALVHGAASAPIVEIPVSAFGRALARGGARLDSVTAAGTDVPPILFIRSPHGIELIDGNNRLAAARAAGRATIKARDLTDVAALHRGQR